MKRINYAIVGIGGWAVGHLNTVNKILDKYNMNFLSAVVRNKSKYPKESSEMESRGIKLYPSLESMLEDNKNKIDVISIPTGIYEHEYMAVKSFEYGCDVVLDKPPTPTVQEIDNIISARQKHNKICAVLFQAIYSKSVQTLKQIVCSGKLGKLHRIKCRALWPRYDNYYTRNTWAGKIKMNGKWTLDGPTNNALAHQLNNMLFLSSSKPYTESSVVSMQAEFYKARDIEGEDTSCIRAILDNGVELLQWLTHCSYEQLSPLIVIEAENGRAEWNFTGDAKIQYNSGETEEFGDNGVNAVDSAFENILDYYQSGTGRINCSIEMTRPYVVAINSAYESSKGVKKIPAEFFARYEKDNESGTRINDIERIMPEAFEKNKLFSELGVEWAKKTDVFEVPADYKYFNPHLEY